MKSRKNMRLLISALITVFFIALALAAGLFSYKKAKEEAEAKAEQLKMEREADIRYVYVANRAIKAGETLTVDNVSSQKIYAGTEQSYFMSEDMIGGIALIPLSQNEPIMASMVTSLEVTDDTRYYEIDVANLMVDQEEDDIVDVRIMFPTGEDYTILSKKTIKELIKESSVFQMLLNEDEIERMASATVDAYTVKGAYIYTVRYVASSLQTQSVPDYVVRPETIDRINSDPNILSVAKETLNFTARQNLEERLGTMLDESKELIKEGHNLKYEGLTTQEETSATFEEDPYDYEDKTTDEDEDIFTDGEVAESIEGEEGEY